MGSGARFYKCDLHVHTPLDVGWLDERTNGRDAAESLVRTCYEAGLQVVAITDHNMASRDLLPLIREHARGLAPEFGFQLHVFPGFEFEANVGLGVHVTCIFDPKADLEKIDHVLTQCGVPVSRMRGGVPEPSRKNLGEILEIVQFPRDGTPKGVVICAHSQKRAGLFDDERVSGWLQAEEFRHPDLMCVEVPKPPSAMSRNWQRLLASTPECDPMWQRMRPVACVMCSDAKRLKAGDHADNYVARRYAWIKMGPPSADGLRHAFLAHQSRVCLAEPLLPALHIERIEVGSCAFFEAVPLVVEFNNQFSALIGGRGTGKSTVIEYLRWALCDQLPEMQADGVELKSVAEKQASLIRNTLENQPDDSAYVRVTVIKNGTRHVITRYAKRNRITLAIADGEEQDVADDSIRQLVAAQAYSQKQLSGVAVRVSELRRLLEAPIGTQLAQVSKQIAEQRAALRALYADVWRAQQLDREIATAQSLIQSADAQAKTLKAEVEGGLSPEDRSVLALREPFMAQNRAADEISRDLQSLREMIKATAATIAEIPKTTAVDVAAPCRQSIGSAIARLVSLRDKVALQLADCANLAELATNEINTELTTCRDEFGRHESAYKDASSRVSSHSGKIKILDELTKSLGEQRSALDVLKQRRHEIPTAAGAAGAQLANWLDLHRQRGDLLEQVATEIQLQSQGDIRVQIRRAADVERAFNLFRDSLSGTGAREAWIQSLQNAITESANPAIAWFGFIQQLQHLAEMTEEESSVKPLPVCPLLRTAGFSDSCLRKIAAKLTTDRWLELMLTSLEDRPVFFFRTDGGTEIPFENASAGQQATALLRVLLSQSGGPLIIDQPEEDLDNAIISQVVESIWAAKERRQLIFASHNANIVVNGDAELVIQCDYAEANKRSLGVVRQAGSIDEPAICQAIRDVMEGGDKAFQLRREKYGF